MKQRFRRSVQNLHSVRAMTAGAVLVAVQVVLAMLVSLPLTESVQITFDRCALALSASMLGPVMGMLCGGLADVIQCLLHGWVYNPGLTLNEVAIGCMYGLFLYRRPAPLLPGKDRGMKGVLGSAWRLILCQTLVCLVINSLLGTLWLCLMYGWTYTAYLPLRLTKNLIQLPVDIVLIWMLLIFRDRMQASGAVKTF